MKWGFLAKGTGKPTPQPGVLDQLDQVIGRLLKGGVQAGVAVQLPEPVDVMGPVVPPAGGQHPDLLGHVRSPRSGAGPSSPGASWAASGSWGSGSVGASGAAAPAPSSGWGSPASRCSVGSGGDGSRPTLRSAGWPLALAAGSADAAAVPPKAAGGSPRPARRQWSAAVDGSVTDPSAANVRGGTWSRSRASSSSRASSLDSRS